MTHFRPLRQKSGKNRLFWGYLFQDTSVSIWSFLTFDWFQELKVPNTRLHLVRQYPYFMMGPGPSIIDTVWIPFTNWPLFEFWFIVLTINDAFILSEIINTPSHYTWLARCKKTRVSVQVSWTLTLKKPTIFGAVT